MAKMRCLGYGLIIFLAGIGSLGAADLANGFLGIKWGTEISELPHFINISEKYDVSYYIDPRKSYTLFDIEVLEVVYGFYAQKFFAVYVNLESIDVFSRLKQRITEKYGQPRTSLNVRDDQTVYDWKVKDTRIKLKHYEKLGKMKLGFYYTPLSEKVNAAQREAFPEMRKPLFPLDERRLQDALDVMGF
jgi:hypothetical protein